MAKYRFTMADVIAKNTTYVSHLPKMQDIMNMFCAPLNIVRTMFEAYVYGFSNDFSPSSYYPFLSVVYYNGYGYVKYTSGSSTGSWDSQSSNWYRFMKLDLGAIQRLAMFGTKIQLEYLLNRRFNTSFYQPIDATTNEIYISDATEAKAFFVAYKTAQIGNPEVFKTANVTSKAIYKDSSLLDLDDIRFSVNIPTALSVSLGTDYENIVLSTIQDYVPEGIKFKVITY